MKTISLTDGWCITRSLPGKGDPAELSAIGLGNGPSWHEIAVPGDVNAVLVRDGRMPDPHIGDNGRQCYWVTAHDWWYRLEFRPVTTEEKITELILDGIDGHADVFLNGQALGRAENAFHPHLFDVTSNLCADAPNVLLLRFEAIDTVMGTPRVDELAGWKNRKVLMRKPQYSFGWDWALPLPSIGIAGDVRLEMHDGKRLNYINVKPHLDGRVDVKLRLSNACCEADYQVIVRVEGHRFAKAVTIHRPGRCHLYTSIQVPDPQLWWPNGFGSQPLYTYRVSLIAGGHVVDEKSGRFGFREIAIEENPFTEDAGPGISFWFKVNGRRIFCKGGNWIPLELWPATARDDQYRFYIQKAVDANFNMLRVWGGGIYEREIFYDLCDEQGIMVWQDFMFASAGYPVDLLRERIIAEAEYQIRRLCNRPCITLWCGINEDAFSWGLPSDNGANDCLADTGVYSDIDDKLKIDRVRNDPQIYTMLLRGLVSKLGLGVPYTESSPQSHDDCGNDPFSGNSHLSAWKFALFSRRQQPEKFREHFEQPQSFDSEFCIQGPCSVASVRRFIPEEHHWPPDDIWEYHIQRGHANIPHHEQTLIIASGIFGEITDLEKYVKYGQATHVEMMRSEFESARRDRPNNGGTMMWMFNDCWPTSNWSIIDYYRLPKPAFYAAKRACAPFLPIVFERAGKIGFFFSNDTPDAVAVELEVGQAHLNGDSVWTRRMSGWVASMDTGCFLEVPREDLSLEVGDFLFIYAVANDCHLPAVTYFPDGWRNITWPQPNVSLDVISCQREETGFQTQLSVASQAFSRLLHVCVSPSAGAHWLSDNFVDLPPNTSVKMTLWSEREVNCDILHVGHFLTDWP